MSLRVNQTDISIFSQVVGCGSGWSCSTNSEQRAPELECKRKDVSGFGTSKIEQSVPLTLKYWYVARAIFRVDVLIYGGLRAFEIGAEIYRILAQPNDACGGCSAAPRIRCTSGSSAQTIRTNSAMTSVSIANRSARTHLMQEPRKD